MKTYINRKLDRAPDSTQEKNNNQSKTSTM